MGFQIQATSYTFSRSEESSVVGVSSKKWPSGSNQNLTPSPPPPGAQKLCARVSRMAPPVAMAQAAAVSWVWPKKAALQVPCSLATGLGRAAKAGVDLHES